MRRSRWKIGKRDGQKTGGRLLAGDNLAETPRQRRHERLVGSRLRPSCCGERVHQRRPSGLVGIAEAVAVRNEGAVALERDRVVLVDELDPQPGPGDCANDVTQGVVPLGSAVVDGLGRPVGVGARRVVRSAPLGRSSPGSPWCRGRRRARRSAGGTRRGELGEVEPPAGAQQARNGPGPPVDVGQPHQRPTAGVHHVKHVPTQHLDSVVDVGSDEPGSSPRPTSAAIAAAVSTAGVEKSSPATRAPWRAHDKVSRPMWHCRCRRHWIC